jgi:prophage regulatory protein
MPQCSRLSPIDSAEYGERLSGDLSKPRSIALLSNDGDFVMRILSKRQVKELVLYSPQHIARLEKAGQFPKRVQLGPNRVGWVECEVLAWLEERMAQREEPN